ncbi:MAG: hypothetical protein U0270_20640 [Labilithrix sp.]
MGIEIAVRGTHRGPPRARKSPFTGAMETYAELEMTDEEYRAASDVIARYGKVDEYGEGRLDLPTAQIEIWGFDFDGCMMNLIGELRGACDFVFELATAARLVVQFESEVGAASALVTSAEAERQAGALDDAAHEELGPILRVTSPAEMWRALAGPNAPPRGVA